MTNEEEIIRDRKLRAALTMIEDGLCLYDCPREEITNDEYSVAYEAIEEALDILKKELGISTATDIYAKEVWNSWKD